MTRWTDVDDLVAILRRRWATGKYLRDYVCGVPWQAVTMPVKAPTATELLHDFDAAVSWEQRFRRDSQTPSGATAIHDRDRAIRGHGLGTNEVPARVRLDTFEQCCALLGTGADVRILDEIISHTRDAAPALLDWVTRYPLAAIDLHDESGTRYRHGQLDREP